VNNSLKCLLGKNPHGNGNDELSYHGQVENTASHSAPNKNRGTDGCCPLDGLSANALSLSNSGKEAPGSLHVISIGVAKAHQQLLFFGFGSNDQ
jgi:hypothetical protein